MSVHAIDPNAAAVEDRSSRATWELVRDWELVLPPLRPSAQQVGRWRLRLEALHRDEPVAVLGSAPEFRDLYHGLGFKRVHVFDRSRRFFDAMSRMRVEPGEETLVEGDWLQTLARFPATFACVLSDLTSGNIAYEQRALFYRLITDALRPGGLFCDKVLVHDRPLLPLDGLLGKYAHRPLNLLTVNEFVCETFFCSDLLAPDGVVDASRCYARLRARSLSPRLRALVAINKRGMPPGSVWFYGRPWSELAAGYCPDLALVEESHEEPGSPLLGWARQRVLQKPRG